MLRSVFLKTLRDQRIAIIAWGLGLGLVALISGIGYAQAYPDLAGRQTFAEQVRTGLSFTEVQFGQPHNLETVAGFVEWRGLGAAPLILGLFMVIATTGVTRGAEESGTIEVVMATPSTRLRVLLQQIAALLVALLAACALTALFTLAAGPASGEGAFRPLRVAGSTLNLFAATALFAAVALLASQATTSRRTAGLVAAAFMFAAHIWNGLGLVVPAIGHVRALSPLYFYSQTSPLATGHMDWASLLVLGGLAAVVAAAAVLLYARRDLFAAWQPPRPREARHEGQRAEARPVGPSPHAWVVRSAYGRGLRDSLGSTAVWAIGLGVFAVLATALAPNVHESLRDSADSALYRRLEDAGLVSERGIVSLILFGLLPPLLSLCAVTLAAAWAREETAGRLEVELSCPPSRTAVFTRRLGAGATSLAIILAAVWLAVTATARAGGVDVAVGRTLPSVAALLPLAMVVVAFGFLVAAVRPGATMAVTGGAVAMSFFASLLIPLFDAPRALADVSIFALYGQPLVDGVDWAKIGLLAALALAFAATGAVRFRRRDIVR